MEMAQMAKITKVGIKRSSQMTNEANKSSITVTMFQNILFSMRVTKISRC